MSKIYAGESFGAYCERMSEARNKGKVFFSDLNKGEEFVRTWDKGNKTVCVKAGERSAIVKDSGSILYVHGDTEIEKIA